MNFLVDENMPRTLAPQIIATDAIIITRDRGFANPKTWPTKFTAGMIFMDLPSNTPANIVNARVLELIAKRLPVSLLGAIIRVEPNRALSQIVRRRA